MKKQTYAIMVLSDGETYTAAKDCEILILNDEGMDLLEEGGSPLDLLEEHLVHTIKFDAYDD